MNKFSLVIGLLQICAAVEAIVTKNYKLAGLWICYAIASFIMAFMKN